MGNSDPSAAGCRSQGVDGVAGECSGDVEACERAELFERDFVVERGLNTQGTHENMGEHGAVGHGLDSVSLGREGATQVGGLFDFAEEQLDEPTQPIGLHDLSSRKLASGHGGEVPANYARGVCDADESQADDVLALAPNDVEVEERAAASRNRSEVVAERPAGNGAKGSVDDVANYAHFRRLLEPHQDMSPRILGGRQTAFAQRSRGRTSRGRRG